ncbi:MAG TPA: DUF4142 domain-containing protein [Capsulimonadaceae bacterium]
MKFKSTAGFLCAAAALCLGSSISQAKPMHGMPMRMSASDAMFAKKAAQGGMLEVKLGRYAADNATDGRVRDFGKRMVADHSKANADLIKVASQQRIVLPKSPDSKQQAMAAKLMRLHGAAFDRAYVKAMVKDHTEDADEFAKEASKGKNPAIKGFAARTLPIIEHHLAMIKDEWASMNGAHHFNMSHDGKMRM